MLNLFRPRDLGGDSLLVVAEWLIHEPGELFWGTDYQYVVLCRGGCEIVTRHGPGSLN